jgi:D-alanyl-D-alanine dipeptidase
MQSWVVLIFFTLSLSCYALPAGFIHILDVDSSIIEEIRYHSDHNFVGRPVIGYLAPKCILTIEAAQKLAKVQAYMRSLNHSLKGMPFLAQEKTMISVRLLPPTTCC